MALASINSVSPFVITPITLTDFPFMAKFMLVPYILADKSFGTISHGTSVDCPRQVDVLVACEMVRPREALSTTRSVTFMDSCHSGPDKELVFCNW